MSPIYYLLKVTAKDAEAHKKLIEMFSTAAKHLLNDPNTIMYAICAPNKEQGGLMETPVNPLEVFLIEGYLVRAIKEQRVSSPQGQEFVKALRSLLAGHDAKILSPAVSFTRPVLAAAENPFIVNARFGYQPGTVEQAIEGWKDLLAYGERDEPETLAYFCFVDGDDLVTVEIYANKEFLYDIHSKSDAIKKNVEQNGNWRTGKNSAVKYHTIAGWLAKP